MPNPNATWSSCPACGTPSIMIGFHADHANSAKCNETIIKAVNMIRKNDALFGTVIRLRARDAE